MVDQSFGDYGQMLRAPDIRIDDVRSAIHEGVAPWAHDCPRTGRGTLVYVMNGSFRLEIDGAPPDPPCVAPGTAIGFEDGRAHKWVTASPPGTPVALLVSTIPRQMSVLRKLDDRSLVLPPDAEPYATAMRLAVELHIHAFSSSTLPDDNVIRRTAEICLIQFVNFTRDAMIGLPNAPAGLAHDEFMLRAWAAYFRDPRRRWTVAALAQAAGLGRTTFAQRFREVFGAPPLQTITDLRLQSALAMLRNTKAPLIEIAFSCGYNSEAAFVRAFHRRYGRPPGRTRQIEALTDPRQPRQWPDQVTRAPHEPAGRAP